MIFAMSPIPNMMPNMAPEWCPNGPQNRSKIDPKTDAKFERISASIFDRFLSVLAFKTGPKGCPRNGGGRLGGALGGIFWLLMSKIVQKCSKGVQKCSKSAAKVPPGTEHFSKNDPKGEHMCLNVSSKRPAFRRVFETFVGEKMWGTIQDVYMIWVKARRTARSA